MNGRMNEDGRRVVFLTGGSRGLGRSMALALAQSGMHVVFTYLQDKKAAALTVEDIHKCGSDAVALCADMRKYSAVRRAVKSALLQMGRIDVLINNVGAFMQKSFNEVTTQEWQDIIDSNLTSVFYCCRCIGAIMRRRGFGKVINIGLANANRIHAYKEVIPYAIAKSGVLILTKSLAVEWAGYGITVNAISPGLMDNGSLSQQRSEEWREKVPMGRLGSGDDITAALLYLISDDAQYVTGTEIIVSGGWGL